MNIFYLCAIHVVFETEDAKGCITKTEVAPVTHSGEGSPVTHSGEGSPVTHSGEGSPDRSRIAGNTL